MTEDAIERTFQEALRLHRAGRLAEADELYRRILLDKPNHAEALHHLGLVAYQSGEPQRALELIGQALSIAPELAEAHSNRGEILKAGGQFDEAIASFRRAIAARPAFPEGYYNLGIVLQARGETEAAVRAFQEAVLLRPDYAEAHGNLGNTLKNCGRMEEAIPALRRAVELRPAYAAGLNNLGAALGAMGKFAEAADVLRRVVAMKPSFAEAHHNLANVLRDSGGLDEAIAEYQIVTALQPADGLAYLRLGETLGERERLVEAAAALRRAVELRPTDARAHETLGTILLRLREIAEAENSFRRAAELEPATARLWNALGNTLNYLGRFPEAHECFQRAIAIDPLPRYYQGLAAGRGSEGGGAAEIDRLLELMAQKKLAGDDRVTAEFVLGKLLDEADRFDEAFAHYAAGNGLYRRMRATDGHRFNGDDLRAMIDRMMRIYDPRHFAEKSGAGDPSELPVFIVGAPRSGTSLVEQILASHPAVFGAGELPKIGELAGHLPPLSETPEIMRGASQYLEHTRSLAAGALRVTDKMPGNVFHLGLIGVLFPAARVIFCRRDARDNCLSSYFQHFDEPHLLYTYDLADCGRQYVETARLAEHWRRTLPLKMMHVEYETLVKEQERESRRMVEFLGLPWDPRCLEFHRTQRAVLTASVWQVRQPMYAKSVGRWRHYQRHLKPLLDVLEPTNTAT